MPKLKPLSPKQFIYLVEKCGYFFVRQKGSHQVFSNKQGGIVTVPIHAGKIDRHLMLKIIKKELKISRDEFEKLLK
jgi:predicted RNA binding protein YcfA (HicA-like mRNA interferase family)